jgi:hypothetical protein
MAGGSPSMPHARPKVRRRFSGNNSPSMPAARTQPRQRQERVATRNYRPPPSTATRQGSPSQPAARPLRKKIAERKADVRVQQKAQHKRIREQRNKRDALDAYMAFRRNGGGDFESLSGRRLRDLFGTPQNVALANYSGHYDRLWKKALDNYPTGAKKPKLDYVKPRNGIAGYVDWGQKAVHIPTTTPMQARLRPSDRKMDRVLAKNPHPAAKVWGKERKDRQNFYRSVPLHEWAHSFQKDIAKMPKAQREGAAETLALKVAKELGQPFHTPTAKYRKYTKAVKGRKDSAAFVRSGQFGGR